MIALDLFGELVEFGEADAELGTLHAVVAIGLAILLGAGGFQPGQGVFQDHRIPHKSGWRWSGTIIAQREPTAQETAPCLE